MMDSATVEEKFYHAVELIKNLPKTGNFQPSNDLKLRFYSYFKQATEGPCVIPKPAFWDYVGKAKWDAWNNIKDMSKEEAMERYVNEFVQILKSEPFDERAEEYVHLMGPYISLAPKEFQEKHQKANGKIPNKLNNTDMPRNGQEGANKTHFESMFKIGKKGDSDISSESSEESRKVNGNHNNGATETDSEDFSDTYDQVNGGQSEHEAVVQDSSDTGYYLAQNHHATKGPSVIEARGGADQRVVSRGSISPIAGGNNRGGRTHRRTRGGEAFAFHNPSSSANGGGGGRRNGDNALEPSTDVSEQLAFAVIRLQHTMDQVVSRLDSLEALLQEKSSLSCVSTVKNSFSSVFGIPPRAAILIVIWPFIANWLLYIIQKRRRRGL